MNSYSSFWAQEKADSESLRQAGFRVPEINHLLILRRRWKPNELDRFSLDPDPAHLCFLRWLVQHGKLTEELSEPE